MIKKKINFSSYMNGAVAKSYMRKGFLIYEEMRKYSISPYIRRPLVIYEFPYIGGKFYLLFLSVHKIISRFLKYFFYSFLFATSMLAFLSLAFKTQLHLQ
jgi:hypothetical protein